MTSASPPKRWALWITWTNFGHLLSSVIAAELLLVGLADSQTTPTGQDVCPPPPTYQYLRADEDYIYLSNPNCRTDALDAVKYIRLGRTPEWFVSLGGEIREDVEYVSNPRWGQQPQGSPYALQRYMVHSDIHLGEPLRAFVQLKSGLENNREGGARPIDEDKLDFHQGFLDLTLFSSEQHHLTLRTGRQEIAFGAKRYISAREGPNVRQTFDGARLTFASAKWNLSLLAMKPVQTNLGFFDDSPDHRQTLWGAYFTVPLERFKGLNADVYYLGLDRNQSHFEQGAGREQRHSIGGRIWGKQYRWDEDIELTYQWGSFAGAGIQAGAATSEIGYSKPSLHLKPRIAIEANIETGDRDPLDKTLQTFNPLFPRGLYHQLIDLNGHVNSVELNPTLALHPVTRMTVTTGWDIFWRESAADGLYNVGGFFIRNSNRSTARYIGSQPSLIVEWRVQRHITAVLIYSHFTPGSFLRQTGPSRAVDYGSIWLDYKF